MRKGNVSELKDYKHRRPVHFPSPGQLNGSQIEGGTIEPEQDETAEERSIRTGKGPMMQCNAHNRVARRFENRCQKHEPKSFHTACPQALK
jgi:hypothetical protein